METTIPFNILLLPLLGGFIFVSKWNRTRWHASRADRERLIIYAALAGFASVVAVFAIKEILAPLIPCRSGGVICVPELWARHIPFEYSGISCSAFALAASLGFALNLIPRWNEDRQTARIVKKEGGPLEQFLDIALHTEKDVLLTMTNGKVYVGVITSSFIPGQRDKTITLWPIWSGYRRHPSHEINYTTNYEKAYTRIENDFPLDHKQLIRDFRLTIPISEIRSVTFLVGTRTSGTSRHLNLTARSSKSGETGILLNIRS